MKTAQSLGNRSCGTAMLGGLLTLSLGLFGARTASAITISVERDTRVPLVHLSVAFQGGAVQDDQGKSGITDFMGEMLLRGTQSRTKQQIDAEIDQMGASLEVETRSETSVVRGTVLSSQVDRFLSLITEVLTRSTFPENEVRKLRDKITSQLMAEQGSDQAIAGKLFNRFLFQGHPYGRPVAGTIRDIAKISRADIQKQYGKLLNGNNLIVLATGDIEPEKIEQWAKKLSAGLPTGEKVKEVVAPATPPQRRLQIVDKPERTQTQIYVGQIGIKMTDPNYFPLYLGNHAFGGGSFQARMMVEIRVKRGWSYGAGSGFRFGLQPRSWQAHLFPASKDTPAALEYTLGMIQDLQRNGITEIEYASAKQSLINSSGFMSNTPKKRMENRLTELTLGLPEGFMSSYGEKLAQVSLEQVNQAFSKFLHPDSLTISVLGTASQLKEGLAKAGKIDPNQIVVTPYTQD